MVTHDRYFLDSVTNRIVELDKGKLYSYQARVRRLSGAEGSSASAMEQASERKRRCILRGGAGMDAAAAPGPAQPEQKGPY